MNEIPAAARRHNLIALGKTRSGKSSKLRVLVEGLLDAAAPVCILDPKGDWWGLKSSADGKSAGYPIVIFGGEHADVPINEHSGAHVAEIIATGNRPALIDLGGWMVGARTRFFVDFAATFFRLSRGARHLVIDEVHNFAPQGRIMDPDAGKMLHWANRLASEGSGKGITLFAASQRPQKVHKDFVTSCETLVACKVIHKLDRDAIKDWIDGCADASKGREVIADLAQLKKPEAWVWCPEVDFGPKRIEFPMFRTYDSFKPQPADAGKLKGWAEVDLDEVKAKLVSVVKEADANDPRKLRARIAELERAAARPTPAVASAPSYPDQRAEVAELRQSVRDRDRIVAHLNSQIGRIAALANLGGQEIPPLPPATAVVPRPAPAPAPRPRAASNGHAYGNRDPIIGNSGKARIMIALAQNQGRMTQRRLSLLSGLSARSGTWSTYLSELRSAGFIEGSDDIRATDAGIAALGDYEPLPTGEELIAYWQRRLGNSGKRAIFDALVLAYPRALTTDEAAQSSGLSPKSGTWSTYLSELRGLELISGRGELKASEELFG